MTALKSGSIIHGDNAQYKIVEIIGQGAFAYTYKAIRLDKSDAEIGNESIDYSRLFAIKEFFMKEVNSRNTDGSVDKTEIGGLANAHKDRFKEEAMTLSRIDHPNIVKFIDFLEDNNTFYYVMEYVEGVTLGKLIERKKTTKDEILQIFSQVSEAVDYLHNKKGILHLDIKPGNIIYDSKKKHSYLIDFGSCFEISKICNTNFLYNVAQGTRGYAPIEQTNATSPERLGVTADIYSLGATLFYMLTGIIPKPSCDYLENDFEILHCLTNAGVSSELAHIVSKAMSVSPSDRYQNVRGFLDSIDSIVIDNEYEGREDSCVVEIEVEGTGEVVYLTEQDKVGISEHQTTQKIEQNSFGNKVRELISKSRVGNGVSLVNTFAKRHPFVNSILSLWSLVTTLLILLFGALMFTFGWKAWLVGLFYPLYCIYYMYQFVVRNRKDAFYFANLGSFAAYLMCTFLFCVLEIPDSYDEDGSESISSDIIIFSIFFFAAAIITLLIASILFYVMKIRRNGASAWSLLDISRKKFRTKLDKVLFCMFFIVWLTPFLVLSITKYIDDLNDFRRTHANAQIGDYYYKDGTISSELLADKEVVGVVYSLEVSDAEKEKGYIHGQIISLEDISIDKMPWESGYLEDYEKYPNYTWDNRTQALHDINGYKYIECEGNQCLSINFDCLKYKEYEVNGLSNWYVPTAGQWTSVLQNLGHVKVDNMLRFDSKVAIENLQKINISPTRWYWTITEFDAENAWSIRLSSGEFGSRTSKQNSAYVRPVASF